MLFADLVGFTKRLRELPPGGRGALTISMRMVRAFDALCAARGIEKIKTIGDCEDRWSAGFNGDPARLSNKTVAQDMLRASGRRRPPLGGRRLPLRIGIHTGSATAGIIGDTRFTYDVWGDAVNIASRIGICTACRTACRYRKPGAR